MITSLNSITDVTAYAISASGYTGIYNSWDDRVASSLGPPCKLWLQETQ